MTGTTLIRFSRSCPTCGRRIQIRSSLLGKVVACTHCKAEFTATANEPSDYVDEAAQLMKRVELMLGDQEANGVQMTG